MVWGFNSVFETFHFNCAWKNGIYMLQDTSRGESVQLFVDAVSNHTWEY